MYVNFFMEGTLGRDPELKYTAAGKAIVRFSIAEYMGKVDESTYRDSNWHTCVAFGDLAERIAEGCVKGTRVVVLGQYKTRKDESVEPARYFTEVDVKHCGVDFARHAVKAEHVETPGWSGGGPARPSDSVYEEEFGAGGRPVASSRPAQRNGAQRQPAAQSAGPARADFGAQAPAASYDGPDDWGTVDDGFGEDDGAFD